MGGDFIKEDSKKEEIAEYFYRYLGISEETKKNIIKEDISGDILYELEYKDFVYLGLKTKSIITLQKLLNENKVQFMKKEIKEAINYDSQKGEVNIFFSRYLNFNKNNIHLDGKAVFKLTEEDMKKLGLNLGQRRKLLKYIKFFMKKNEDEQKFKENSKILKEKIKKLELIELFYITFYNNSKKDIIDLIKTKKKN